MSGTLTIGSTWERIHPKPTLNPRATYYLLDIRSRVEELSVEEKGDATMLQLAKSFLFGKPKHNIGSYQHVVAIFFCPTDANEPLLFLRHGPPSRNVTTISDTISVPSISDTL